MSFRIRVYPHNDLGNLAHYHREIVNTKVAKGDVEGISLDCMSFLIALAFEVEAFVNFVGHRRIKNWNERAAYSRKMKALSDRFRLPFNPLHEPHVTLALLRDLRNQLAHGKPSEFISSASSKAEMREAISPIWSGYLHPAFINSSYEQVKEFEAMLMKAAHIPLAATLSSAVGGGT